MDRRKMLEKAFQRGHLLTLKNPMYKAWIRRFIVEEVKGDVGWKGDITTQALLRKGVMSAAVEMKQGGIIAGLEEAVFLYKSNGISTVREKKDGERVKKGDIVLRLRGNIGDLLRIERSVLDLLQRMSGIATLTSELIKKAKEGACIAPTRKTQWRYLDKKAVFVGGGLTHRLALWESILIKDTHLAALRHEGIADPISYSIIRAWKSRQKSVFIEIEVSSLHDAFHASQVFKELHAGNYPCLIMLDNMKPMEIKKVVLALKKQKLYGHILIEASGGITPENIDAYASTGVDVLSLGYLTHSSHALDMKQYLYGH